MRGDKDGLILAPCQFAQQFHQLHLAWIVEEGSGLVKEYHGGVLSERLGYHHLLTLTVAESLHLPLPQILYPYKPYGSIHSRLILLPQGAPEAGVRHAPQAHQRFCIHILQGRFLGEDNPYGARQVAPFDICD